MTISNYLYINRDKDITRKKLVIAMTTKEIEARKTLRCNIFFVFNIEYYINWLP